MTGYVFNDPWFWAVITIGISTICGSIGYLLGMQRGQYDANQRWKKAEFQLENMKERV